MATTMEKMSRNAARAALQIKLEQKLATLPENTPLPPMRDLMQEYRVGTTKLNTVITQMEEAGLLVRKARSGIYKAKLSTSNLSVPFIDVIYCGAIHDTNISEGVGLYTRLLFSELTTTVSKHGRGCRMHTISKKDNLEVYRKQIASAGMKAVILVSQHLPDITDILNEQHISWVTLSPRIHTNTSRAILDSPDRTKFQLEHLFKLGHTRIAYLDALDDRSDNLNFILWREAFYRIMANRHLEVKEHWVQSPGCTEEGIRQALQAVFASKPYPTAVVVRDYDLPIAYRFLESIGLMPGKDVSFIAHNDLPFVAQLHPPGTSVVNSPAIAAKITVDMLIQVMAGNEPQRPQFIPLSIVERESTSSVEKAE